MAVMNWHTIVVLHHWLGRCLWFVRHDRGLPLSACNRYDFLGLDGNTMVS